MDERLKYHVKYYNQSGLKCKKYKYKYYLNLFHHFSASSTLWCNALWDVAFS